MKRLLLTALIVLLLSSVSMAMSIRVTWPQNPATDGITIYTIYMISNNTTGTGFVKGQNIVGKVGSAEGVLPTTYFIENVVDSPSHCVRLTATNTNGESNFSLPSYVKVDTTPPAKVGNLTTRLVIGRVNRLTVTWPFNAVSDGVTKYRIYIKAGNYDGSGFVKGEDVVGTVKGTIRSYTYNIRASSHSFCVRVTAMDATGNESEFSNPAYFIVP